MSCFFPLWEVLCDLYVLSICDSVLKMEWELRDCHFCKKPKLVTENVIQVTCLQDLWYYFSYDIYIYMDTKCSFFSNLNLNGDKYE